MSNEELVLQIKAGINEVENMRVLWEQNEGMVKKIANKFKGFGEFEDLVQEGYFGICHAVEGYDPSHGVKFLTYATHWIEQVMRRYIDNHTQPIRIPIETKDKLRRYRKVETEFRKEYDRKPTEEEVCYLMGISRKQLDCIQEAAAVEKPASLSAEIKTAEENLTLMDAIPSGQDMESEIGEAVDREQISQTVWNLVDGLSDQMSTVIRGRYQNEQTLQELGDQLGLSRERIRQIESKAMRELRKPSNNKKLRPYFDEYLSGIAYRHVGVSTFQRTGMSATEQSVWRILEEEERMGKRICQA